MDPRVIPVYSSTLQFQLNSRFCSILIFFLLSVNKQDLLQFIFLSFNPLSLPQSGVYTCSFSLYIKPWAGHRYFFPEQKYVALIQNRCFPLFLAKANFSLTSDLVSDRVSFLNQQTLCIPRHLYLFFSICILCGLQLLIPFLTCFLDSICCF